MSLVKNIKLSVAVTVDTKKKKDFDPDEVKYDAGDYESFNGA